MSNYLEIKLSQIVVGENNPRKTFENESLNELAESISKNGVIQPIVVRSINDDKYELVCGERRFRASKIAKQKNIPAMVKELTDEQAFEMQIIENLERKDVHPIEEANAFKRLFDTGNYSLSDIALKFAKSEKFTAQRLKLNDLIEEIQEDFRNDILTISQANLIARLSNEEQQKIISEHKENFSIDGYGTYGELKEFIQDDLTTDLDKAVFDLSDNNLIPETKSCINCSLRSGANPRLFSDFEEPNICFKFSCFQSKTNQSIYNTVNNLITERPNIVFTCGYRGDENLSDQLKEMLLENEIILLKQYTDYHSTEKEDQNSVESYNIEKGEFIFITIKNNSEGSEQLNKQQANPFQDAINTLETRATRGLELDNEKVYKRVIEEIIEEPNNFNQIYNETELDVLEKKALLYDMISNVDLEIIKRYAKFDNDHLPWGMDKIDIIDLAFCDELYNVILRRHITRTLINNHELNYQKYAKPLLMVDIIKIYYPEQISLFVDEQKEIAEKRIEKNNKKIEELKAQLDNANS